MKRILIAYRLMSEGLEELIDNYDITFPEQNSHFTKEEILELIPEYEVFVPSFNFYTDREIIDRGKKLELISNFGVGFNNIDIDYATKVGIVVTNLPNSTTEPTAELTFALLLGAARRIGYYDRKLRTPEGVSWGLYKDAGVPVYGKTLGIIGMGRIGESLARRATASGMKIIYHNRNRAAESVEKRYGAEYVSLEKLLRSADFISLNAPSTPETYRMIGEKEFEMMKPTAIFINTARGNMVNEKALIKSLREKKILAAGLDVYDNEPNINPELLQLDNLLLSPHAGTKAVEYRVEMSIEMSQNIIGFYEGRYPFSRVN